MQSYFFSLSLNVCEEQPKFKIEFWSLVTDVLLVLFARCALMLRRAQAGKHCQVLLPGRAVG